MFLLTTGCVILRTRGPDVELCAIGPRPWYLAREFSHVIIVAVNVSHPPAKPNTTCDMIHPAIAQLQTQYPSSFIAILDDFNHANTETSSSLYFLPSLLHI